MKIINLSAAWISLQIQTNDFQVVVELDEASIEVTQPLQNQWHVESTQMIL